MGEVDARRADRVELPRTAHLQRQAQALPEGDLARLRAAADRELAEAAGEAVGASFEGQLPHRDRHLVAEHEGIEAILGDGVGEEARPEARGVGVAQERRRQRHHPLGAGGDVQAMLEHRVAQPLAQLVLTSRGVRHRSLDREAHGPHPRLRGARGREPVSLQLHRDLEGAAEQRDHLLLEKRFLDAEADVDGDRFAEEATLAGRAHLEEDALLVGLVAHPFDREGGELFRLLRLSVGDSRREDADKQHPGGEHATPAQAAREPSFAGIIHEGGERDGAEKGNRSAARSFAAKSLRSPPGAGEGRLLQLDERMRNPFLVDRFESPPRRASFRDRSGSPAPPSSGAHVKKG